MANRSTIAAAVLAGSVALALVSLRSSADPIFHPAAIVSAGSIGVPFNSTAVGMVELRVVVSKSGRVQDVEVLHDLASVTEKSEAAVRSWQFSPAMMGADAVASHVTVAIFFCPYVGPTQLTLPGGGGGSGPDVPVEITSAQFPVDVNGRRTGGTVVLQVTVSPDGKPGLTKVVHGFEPMNDHSMAAVKNWQFAPASLQGQNIRSNIVIAFVFRPPTVATPY